MKRIAKLGLAAFAALFLALCMLPTAGMLFAPTEEAVGNEHLAVMPALREEDGSWNTAYGSQLSTWLADHIAFRHQLITLHARLCGGLFGTLPGQEVVLGSDGWLYYADTLPDYQGVGLLSDRQCYAAARVLALMQEYCRQQGAQFLFTVAPNKNSLYPEAMPLRYRPAAVPGNAERIAARLEEMGVGYLDLFALLGGEEERLYFRTDSHWNALGAALAGDALSAALGKGEERFYGQPYTLAPTHKGDLYEMVYPAGDLVELDASFDRGFDFVYPQGFRTVEDITIRTRDAAESGSLLMFRDSFGNNLYPFLAERYGAACFSRAMPYNLSYIQREQADTVVVEIVERNLRWLVERPCILPAPLREDAAPDSWQRDGTMGAEASAAPAGQLEGYLEVSGVIRCDGMDVTSPVYLRTAEGRVYEALPAGEGENPFTLYLPEGTAADGLELAVTVGGELHSCPVRLTGP